MHSWPGMFPIFFGLWMIVKIGSVVIALWLLYRIVRALEEMVDIKKERP